MLESLRSILHSFDTTAGCARRLFHWSRRGIRDAKPDTLRSGSRGVPHPLPIVELDGEKDASEGRGMANDCSGMCGL